MTYEKSRYLLLYDPAFDQTQAGRVFSPANTNHHTNISESNRNEIIKGNISRSSATHRFAILAASDIVRNQAVLQLELITRTR